ncbi:hypothetical protein OnM2_087011 [Erysiphe neolycopersici]|uniref:Uncharacterized protein n=1 Tax=Erysiphe neolycopersici TaxID=212602 RepID=A0A420HE85_9PEZI|nr:hypothetical protein OnM2_087011 [Erysiphe neolycopersici]
MFSSPKSRKRRYDEEGSFQVIFEIGSGKTQYPTPSTISRFSETPETTGFQYYGLEALDLQTKEIIESDRRFSPSKTTKLSNSREPYTKRQCFTYFSRDLRDDKQESLRTENFINPRFGNEEMRDRGCIRACHICRRKPLHKNETEFCSTCESCHRSTCYVCLRQCNGKGIESNKGIKSQDSSSDFSPNEHATESRLNTHYENICSRCCVEQRTDGEVRCFGCLNQIV